MRAARWAGGGAGAALGGKVGKTRGGVVALAAARAERKMGEGWLGDPRGEVGREGSPESERRRVGFVRRAGRERPRFGRWKMYWGREVGKADSGRGGARSPRLSKPPSCRLDPRIIF